jgi:hypothetical protein
MVYRSDNRLLTCSVVLLTLFSLVSAIRSAPFDFPARAELHSEPSLESQAPGPHVVSGPEWPEFREAPAFRNGRQCAFVNRTENELDHICDRNSVHIAMTLDVKYLRGSMAAVFSILKHTACPENVIFHFFAADRDEQLRSLIFSTFPFLRFKVYHFNEALVNSRISPSVRPALEHPLNYARSYLADILEPCIQRVIYLDSDLIVVDDIVKLWGTKLGPHAIGAPEYCHTNITKYFTERSLAISIPELW